MNRQIGKWLAVLLCSVLLCGCTKTEEASVRKITAEEAEEMLNSESDYLLLDVREQSEYDSAHIPGAVCIPYTALEERKEELPEDPDYAILVYCRSGKRSAVAAETLLNLGYRNVLDLGGIIDWPYETTSEQASEADAQEESEHQWEDFDCNYQICTICGKKRTYLEAQEEH